MANIKRQIGKVPNPQLVIAGIAVTLLGSFGIGVVMAWGSGSDEVTGVAPSVQSTSVQSTLDDFAGGSKESGPVRARCPECGVIESMRLIQKPGEESDADVAGPVTKSGRRDAPKKLTEISEVTIRMSDGASHRFLDENPTNWRRGERIIFIAGENKTND